MKMNAISHTRKAALAYLTIAAVLFSAVLTQINPFRVRPVHPVDVGSDDYVFNDLTDPPGYDYAAEAGVVYGTVDIPSENQQDHCMYNFSIVGVSAEIGTPNISPGGRVNIMDAGTDPGSLSVTTLAPSFSAFWNSLICFCFFCCGRIIKNHMMAKIATIMIRNPIPPP